MPNGLSTWSRERLSRPMTYATLATTSAAGSPIQAVIWYALRDDDILVNSRVGRSWSSNLLRDPRYSLLAGDEWDWVAVRGMAEALHDRAQAVEDIIAMAEAYHTGEPDLLERSRREFREQERISFLLHPERVTEHPDAR